MERSSDKILVIDPDAPTCRAIRDVLGAAGFTTLGAHSELRARSLVVEGPRPAALVVGASDPFWRDGMVGELRALDPRLVIVALLRPADEYEALLELGASACSASAALDPHLPTLLGRLLVARSSRTEAASVRTPSAPARDVLESRLDTLFREAIASPRAPVGAFEVRVRVWDEYAKLAPQIKRGSLFVETDTPRQVAEGVRVRLVVPDGRSLELTAEVKHVVSVARAKASGKQPGMGVHFVDLADEQQQALAAFDQASRGQGASPPPSVDPPRSPSAQPTAYDRQRKATVPEMPAQMAASAVPRRPVARQPAIPITRKSSEAPERVGSPRFDVRSAVTRPLPVVQVEATRAAPSSSGPAPEPSSGAGRTKLDELREKLAVLARADCFSALGVSVDAGPEDVRLAFFALAKKWHPNKFATDGAEVRDLATEIFIALKTARDTLSDPKKLAIHRARFEVAAAGSSPHSRAGEALGPSSRLDSERWKSPSG